MSVQFGRWSFEGQAPGVGFINKVSAMLAPCGPDSNEMYVNDGVAILYRAFHTTKESHREVQPHVSPSGTVITWDGLLDNRPELIGELRGLLTKDVATAQVVAANFAPMQSVHEFTDVEIVAGAYDKWGTDCLGKLIGDWALSIWNPRERSVVLAKDPIGTKHLYYSTEKDHVTWSTILDPLVLFAGRTLELCEEYIAGWFSYFPATHLTPYVGIHSVPPSSSVLLRPGKHSVSKYWDFNPGNRIRYRTDAEYEEHFRAAFAKGVQRKLRSDRPVLAELSGGMDSSSIVCMADAVIARGAAETPRLDTISWYDDSYDHLEPDSNELHWITKVEEKRGRSGFHINLRELAAKEVGLQQSLPSEFDNHRLAAIPSPNKELSEHFKQYAAYMLSQGHRVTLSGIGGDEVTGGDVPTPSPEIQNLMARAQFSTLVHQLKAWATKMRKPPLLLLWKAARGFFSFSLTGRSTDMRPAPWFHSGFVRRNRAVLCGYPSRVKLFGPLPSFQGNVTMLNVLRTLVADFALQPEMLREVRFPYLDRDFLEFLFAIPREQIVGVGRRRFLMKRALVGIVPDELLNRRRKGFVQQEPEHVSTEWARLTETDPHVVSSSRGFINRRRLWEALHEIQRNEEVPSLSLMRTVTLESWLRHLAIRGVLTNPTSTQTPDHYSRHSECLSRAPKGTEDRSLFACAARGESQLAPLAAQKLEASVQLKKSASKLCT